MIMHLVLKDYRLLFRPITIPGMILFLSLFTWLNGSDYFSIVNIFFIVSLLILTGIEEKNNTHSILNSLPVRRRVIVQGKYIFAYTFAALTYFIVQVIVGFYTMYLETDRFSEVTFFEHSFFISFILLFIAIYFPITFGIRTKHNRIRMAIFIITIVGIIAATLGFWLWSYNNPLAHILTIVALIIINAFSIRLSCKLYERQEF